MSVGLMSWQEQHQRSLQVYTSVNLGVLRSSIRSATCCVQKGKKNQSEPSCLKGKVSLRNVSYKNIIKYSLSTFVPLAH